MLTTPSPQKTETADPVASTQKNGSITQHEGFADNREVAQKKVQLQKGIIQRLEAESPPSDDAEDNSFSLNIEQDMILLEGQLTMTARFKRLFGSESTFSKLIKKVNAYRAAKSDEEKDTIKPDIISLGETWLDKNKDRKESTDELKRNSITRIVNGLKSQDKKVELANMTDKITFSAKVKEFFTGDESTYSQLQTAFLDFQKEASGFVDSFAKAYTVLEKGQAVLRLSEEWKKRHIKDGQVDSPEKLADIEAINKHLGLVSISTRLFGRLDFELKKINVGSLIDGSFEAQEASISAKFEGGIARGRATKILVSEQHCSFDEITLSYDGVLSPYQGIHIAKPSVSLRSIKDNYIISANGELDIDLAPNFGLTAIEASGAIHGSYNFAEKTFNELAINKGSINLTLFDDLNMIVNDLNLANGKISAKSGTLKSLAILNKQIQGSVVNPSYSAAEGFNMESATLSSPDELAMGDLLKVKQPSLELAKAGSGWKITGSGSPELALSIASLDFKFEAGTASMTYDLGQKKITDGQLLGASASANLSDYLTITASEMSYKDGVFELPKASATVKVTGKTVNANLTGARVNAEGVYFDACVIKSEDTFEPIDGLKLAKPSITLTKLEKEISASAQGTLDVELNPAFGLSHIKASGELSGTYDFNKKTFSKLAVANGSLALSLFDKLHMQVNDIQLSDGLLSASSGILKPSTILGKEINGSIVNPSYAADKGFDMESGNIQSPDELGIGELLKVKQPALTMNKAGEDWEITGSGEPEINAHLDPFSFAFNSGTASLTYNLGQNKITDGQLQGASATAKLSDYLTITASEMSYKDGEFGLPKADAVIAIGGKTATADLTRARVQASGVYFDTCVIESEDTFEPINGLKISKPSITLTKLENELTASANGKLDVTVNPAFGLTHLTASGELSGDYDFNKKTFSNLSVAEGSLELSLFDKLHMQVNDIQLSDGHLSASAGVLKPSNILGKEISGSVVNPSYAAGKGFDMESASLNATDEIGISNLIKVTNPSLIISKNGDSWEIGGSGKVSSEAAIPLVKLDQLEGDLAINYDLKTQKFTKTKINGGAIDATVFNLFKISATDIDYENEHLTVGTATGNITGGNFFDKSGPSVTAKGIDITKDEINWAEAIIKLSKDLEMGNFKFVLPDAQIIKSPDHVTVNLNDTTASFKKDQLTAEGKASLEWKSNQTGILPKVTSGNLDMKSRIDANIPGSFLPFAWPLNFDFSTILIPAPVPVSVGVGLNIDGGIQGFTVEAGIVYQDDAFKFTGNIGADASIGLALRITAGVGSPLIVYIGGFIEASASADVKSTLGVAGQASKQSDGNFALDELMATYEFNPAFRAKLSGGFEARALYFFRKDLYKIDIKEWDLGSSKIAGSKELISGKKEQTQADKLFNTSTGDRTDIPAAADSYENYKYGEALERLYGILRTAGVDTSVSTIRKIETDDVTTEGEVATDTRSIKDRVKQILVDQYNEPEVTLLTSRLRHYDEKIVRIQNRKETRWFTGQEAFLQRNIEKRQVIVDKLTAIRNSYSTSLTIYNRLDTLIKPKTVVTLADVEREIQNYQLKLSEVGSLSDQLQVLKAEMEQFVEE